MASTPVITGKDGVVSLAAAAINGKLSDWKIKTSSENVENSGAGDAFKTRSHVRGDYSIDVEMYAFDQAAWDLHAGLIGTDVVYALKRKSTDTNPYATGTGLFAEHEADAPASGSTTVKFTILCNQGVAPTLDTTPAT